MIQEDQISRTFTTTIDQIDPLKYYPKSYFTKLEHNNEKASYLIIDAIEDNIIQYFPQKGQKGHLAHLVYGQDVIALLQEETKKIQSIKSHAEKIAADIDPEEIINLIKENLEIKTKIVRLKKETKKIQENFTALSQITEEYQKKISMEISNEERLKKTVLEYLFENKKQTYWFQLDMEKTCGVYFLRLQNKIVYIGQSINVIARTQSHIADGKLFDSVQILPCKKEDLLAKEMFFIKLIKPPLNGAYKNTAHESLTEIPVYNKNLQGDQN